MRRQPPNLTTGLVRESIQRAVAECVDEPGEAARIADAVLDRLASSEVTRELARLIEVLQERADNAWNLRDDIYACPDGPEPRARIAVNAFLHAIGQDRPMDDDELDAGAAQAVLDRIEYRDWKFHLLELPDGARCVRVTAKVPNTYRDGKPFSITRRGWSRRTLLEAAFNGVMAIEEHEARERFLFDGKRPFDPHADSSFDPVPEPVHPDSAAG